MANRLKIKTIKQWGDNPWKSMNSAFAGCAESYYRSNRRKPRPFPMLRIYGTRILAVGMFTWEGLLMLMLLTRI